MELGGKILSTKEEVLPTIHIIVSWTNHRNNSPTIISCVISIKTFLPNIVVIRTILGQSMNMKDGRMHSLNPTKTFHGVFGTLHIGKSSSIVEMTKTIGKVTFGIVNAGLQ
jgi:hypothetical protein